MNFQKIKTLKHSIIIAIATFMLLLVGCRLLHPLYLTFLNEDIYLEVRATAENCDSALSNNVRLKSIAVNGIEVNLGKAELSNGWSYLSTDDFIYIYNLEKASSFEIQLSNVHTLEFTFVGEVGSGIIQIYFNGELWCEEDLYRDAEWELITMRYDSSLWVFPEKSSVLMLTAILISCIAGFLISFLSGKQLIQRIVYASNRIIVCFALTVFVLAFSLIVQYQGFLAAYNHIITYPEATLKSFVLLFILLLLVIFIFRRIWLAFGLLSLIVILLNIISLVKLENRGVPLLPWDFSMISEALSIQSSYQFTFAASDFIVFLAAFVIAIGLFCFLRKEPFSIPERLAGSIGLLLLFLAYINYGFINGGLSESDASYRTYQVSAYYEKRGFLTAFTEYLYYLQSADEPDDYNSDTMEEIVAELNEEDDEETDETADDSDLPTIIAIMSESFWDISRLESLDFEESVLPVYESLKEESLYGELLSHVYGGGTEVSEFEFLTGFSGEFFPTDYMVYGNFLTSGFDSAVSILEDQGYATMAFHPYLATNYNRETAYELFGFDQSFFADDFTDDVKMVRNYISDESLFDKMIAEYEAGKEDSDQPLFLFAVTMQNHGGYWESTIYEDGLVEFSSDVYQDSTMLSIKDYVAGLHESDRALGELIDYFREVDEKVIVIYFGDHMSDAGPKDEKLLDKAQWADEDSITKDYENHIVPFIVWSNFSSESQDLGIMAISQLFPTVLESYSIEKPAFWDFLIELKGIYAATDSMIVVNQKEIYSSINEMTDIQQQYYNKYKLLQYDYIFGNQYAISLWE